MELSKEAREARRAYSRKWQANNKDKVRASKERYWEKKAKLIQQQKEEEELDAAKEKKIIE